jgi:hypothetical protein
MVPVSRAAPPTDAEALAGAINSGPSPAAPPSPAARRIPVAHRVPAASHGFRPIPAATYRGKVVLPALSGGFHIPLQ